MAYIANKVCRFAGHDFLKGEVVPDDLVLKTKVPQLLKTGVLVESKEEKTEPIFSIPVVTSDGSQSVALNVDEVTVVFNYLGSKNADESKAIVDTVMSKDLLIILEKTEQRKGMKDYIKNRFNQLSEME